MKREIVKILVLGEDRIKKEFLKVHVEIEPSLVVDHSLITGVYFHIKHVELENLKVSLQVWDFAAVDRFKYLHRGYVKGALGALIFFDFANRQSFDNLTEWINLIRNNVGQIPIILIGIKSHSESLLVSQKEIESLISDFDLNYFETSVISKEDASNIFYRIASMALYEKSKRQGNY